MRIINQLPAGEVSYLETDLLQRQIHQEVDQGGPDTLIVSRFSPTYTAGRATKPQDIKDAELPVVETDRAGSVTWHGPGQLVVYPIVRLANPRETVGYIRAVENGVLTALQQVYQLPVSTVAGRAGIWWTRDDAPDLKICAIGLKISKSATLHGFALNVDPDFSRAFQGIIPCGLDDAWVCSMQDFGIKETLEGALENILPYFLSSLTPVLARTFYPEDVNWVSKEQYLGQSRG